MLTEPLQLSCGTNEKYPDGWKRSYYSKITPVRGAGRLGEYAVSISIQQMTCFDSAIGGKGVIQKHLAKTKRSVQKEKLGKKQRTTAGLIKPKQKTSCKAFNVSKNNHVYRFMPNQYSRRHSSSIVGHSSAKAPLQRECNSSSIQDWPTRSSVIDQRFSRRLNGLSTWQKLRDVPSVH